MYYHPWQQKSKNKPFDGWRNDGYPAGGGIMVSGGNMANFVGFLAARKAKAGWDVRKLERNIQGEMANIYFC